MSPLYIGLSLLSNTGKDAPHREALRILGLLTGFAGAPGDSGHGAAEAAGIARLISREAGGRPYFTDHRGDFNLSHAGRMVAVTYTQERSCTGGLPLRTGCDIEQARARGNLEAVARHFFAPEEQAYISEGAGDAERRIRFYELWVVKECFLKTLGLGIGHITDSPNCIRDHALGRELLCPAGGAAGGPARSFTVYLYELGRLPEAGYMLALAQEQQPPGGYGLPAEPGPRVCWFSPESLPLKPRARLRVLLQGRL